MTKASQHDFLDWTLVAISPSFTLVIHNHQHLVFSVVEAVAHKLIF